MAGFVYKDDSKPPVSKQNTQSSASLKITTSYSTVKRPPVEPLVAPSTKKTRNTPPLQPPPSNKEQDPEDILEIPDDDEMHYLERLHDIEHQNTSTTKFQSDVSRVQSEASQSNSVLNKPPLPLMKSGPSRPSNTNLQDPSVSTPSARFPRHPTSRAVETSLQKLDIHTLYNKRHACISQIVVLQQRMISIHLTGECDSGEDYGCLEHTKSYLDERLGEYNAEVKRREINGNTLEVSKSVVPTSAPRRFDTPLNRTTLTSPSTSSRFSGDNPILAPRQSSPDDQIGKPSQPVAPERYVNRPVPRTHVSNEFTSFQRSPASTSLRPNESIHNIPENKSNPSSVQRQQPEYAKQSQQESVHELIEPDFLDGIFSDNEEFDLNDNETDNIERNQDLDIEEIDDSADLNLPQELSGSIDIIRPTHNQTASSRTNVSTNPTPSVVNLPVPVEEEDFSKKMQHPWSRDVGKALVKIFKLLTWRHNQIDAINTTLSGKDCFVLMPTGGGKSLCYQLPAVVRSGATKGVTVVISPLISLITDQVQALCQKEIGAAAFTGSMCSNEREYVTNDLRSADPALCLIYVTPEMIMRSSLFSQIIGDLRRRQLLARIVFDEAHCVSQWGHDFRPDYKDVGPKLRKEFPGVPFMALTATANMRVQQDVMSNLGITGCRVLTQSFNRVNLRYEVRPKTKDVLNDIIRIITVDHQGESGIIYCLSKKACEEVAGHLLSKHRIKAHHYHAGMSKDDRQNIQNAWQTGKLQVICATIAFGMGIDKPDVRFVVHHSMPSSLEGYYQETGRAGRDGKVSECILFYAYRDYTAFMRMVEQNASATKELIERQQANAKQVVGFCLNKLDCRRALILSYFGETFSPSDCRKTCDTCMNPERIVMKDVAPLVKSVIKLVRHLASNQSFSVTLVHVVDVFRGSKSKKITNAGHDQIEGAGEGSSLDRTDAERLLHLMVAKDILNERFETNGMGFVNAYVQLSPGHRTFLNGNQPITMAFNVGATSAKRNAESEAPRAVIVRDRKRTTGNVAPIQNNDQDFFPDDEDATTAPNSAPSRKPRSTTSNGPPVRGAVKQQALACLKAKRQLNSLQQNSVNENPSYDPESCYKALLSLRNTLIHDNSYEGSDLEFPQDDVLQTLACLRPLSKDELSKIDGISKRFIDQHSTSILKILRHFSSNNDKAAQNNHDNQIHNGNQSSNSLTKTNSSISLRKHLSKYVAPSSEGVKNKPAPRRSNINNQRSTSGTSMAAIKPMPIPR